MNIEHCCDDAQRYMGLRLRMFDNGYAHLDSSWNMHDVCSPYTRLYYVYSGKGEVISQSGEHELRAGYMYMIPSRVKFDCRCEGALHKLYIHVVLEMPDGFDMLSGFGDVLELPMDSAMGEILQSVYLKGDMASAFRVKSIVMDTLARFTEVYGKMLRPISSYSLLVSAAFKLIKRKLSSQLTLKSIADSLGMNSSTLGKRFRSETGISVSDYIDGLLMQKLQRLLLSSSATLSEIADDLGFCDQFYMSRYFKKRQGETPSAYRKRLGGAV